MIKDLQQFGLSEKEAKVYLALLELGQATVQQISSASGVNRATTYVQLESLKADGLASQTTRGKRTIFVAESPENVNRIIQKEKVDILYKEKQFNQLLPDLKAMINQSEKRPNVRFFEGVKAIHGQRAELVNQGHDRLYEIGYVDPGYDESYKSGKIQQDAKGIIDFYLSNREVKSIIIYDNPSEEFRKLSREIKKRHKNFQLKVISSKQLMIEDELWIMDKSVWMSYDAVSVIIEDSILTENFANIFGFLWSNM